jgi:D-alanyl-D-alanine carboxypeptidase
VANTNTRFLDSYEGADGIKTGYTAPAGFNLTASAHRGSKHIIATVFGGTSTANRNAKMAELMDLGFGKAKNNVAEQPPEAAPLDDALIASVETGIDEIDAEGGAGKTVRVSGEVKTSPVRRPARMCRPSPTTSPSRWPRGSTARWPKRPPRLLCRDAGVPGRGDGRGGSCSRTRSGPRGCRAARATVEVAPVEPEAATVEVAAVDPAVATDAPGSFEAQAAAGLWRRPGRDAGG